MVVLIPSKGIQDEYDIDFRLLSVSLSAILETIWDKKIKRKKVIKVYKANNRGNSSYYCPVNNIIYIHNESAATTKDFIETILHELRHWQQYNILKISFNSEKDYIEEPYEDYINCRVEKDAANFENLYTIVWMIYSKLVDIKNNEYTEIRE